MKKCFLCFTLALGLCLPSALAAGSGFADVKDTDWFASYVGVCAENGLMKGTGGGNFSPGGTVTVAEAAAIAARLGERLNRSPIVYGTPVPGETLAWYHWYVEYLKGYGLTLTRLEDPITRQEFFLLLSAVTPSDSLLPINSIRTLPDTQDESVLTFYNAGILTGTDGYGTFSPNRGLTRSEVAAMVARILDPELRQSFTPWVAPTQEDRSFNSQTAMVVNGRELTVQELVSWITQAAYYQDSYYYNNFNTRLTWDEDISRSILEQAENFAAAYVVMSAKADELGCTLQELSAALTPSPTREELAAYVQKADLLRAKHILVPEEAAAQSVITALESQPTIEQFENILSILGTDPGMTNNPDGYLFTAGDMVEEFEAGTRALDVGRFSSQPVKSSFGYHVILRLDPLDHPDLVTQYREEVMNDQVDLWLAAASIRVNDSVVEQIDVQRTYNAYLQTLSAQQDQ